MARRGICMTVFGMKIAMIKVEMAMTGTDVYKIRAGRRPFRFANLPIRVKATRAGVTAVRTILYGHAKLVNLPPTASRTLIVLNMVAYSFATGGMLHSSSDGLPLGGSDSGLLKKYQNWHDRSFTMSTVVVEIMLTVLR
jgi:hypothetical protein